MDSQSLNLEGRDPPQPGDIGIFTLFYQYKNIRNQLRIKCQLSHVAGSGVGINLNYGGLTNREQDLVAQIIEKGPNNIDL